MDKEVRKEAVKQYFHYFRIWFIILGVLAVICAMVFAFSLVRNSKVVHNNTMEPEERVYDYADILTGEEEQKLREYIAKYEQKYHIDLVLVTINEDVESQGDWQTVMMEKADDFYDEKAFGYNEPHGDGVLLLDNWYADENGSQKGSWLSTSGSAESQFSMDSINSVLDAVAFDIDDNPYAAYKAYIKEACWQMRPTFQIPIVIIVILPLIIAWIFYVSHLKPAAAEKNVALKAYVAGGQPVLNQNHDMLLRKNVTTRRIQTSSSSGGSGRSSSSGGGGHHVSSGGHSHGGGGRRR